MARPLSCHRSSNAPSQAAPEPMEVDEKGVFACTSDVMNVFSLCTACKSHEYHDEEELDRGSEVVLRIYDITEFTGIHLANEVFRLIGTGAYHVAVEIYGAEWSYGAKEDGTGMFVVPPAQNNMHTYREQLSMGFTKLSTDEVNDLLIELSLNLDWEGGHYDLVKHNCCHFSDMFCQRLGVGKIPIWLTDMSRITGTLKDGIMHAQSVAKAAAVIAAKEVDGNAHITL